MVSRPALTLVATVLVLLAPQYVRTRPVTPHLPHVQIINLSTE